MKKKSQQIAILALAVMLIEAHAETPPFDLKIEQITSGEKHHFFGYIGQCQTIPWNAGERYILGMEIDQIERMPAPEEAATVFLIDTQKNNELIPVDKTHAWNPQQGTMFYWNPLSPETQFFFNDRDVESGKVFTVLYDVEKRQRVREYRYDDTPIGNGGVAADGSAWLGLNYGRLARLRLVTGYPDALDWSKDDPAPENDGLFIVDIKTGEKRLLVSYRQLEAKLKEHDPEMEHTGLFINHTLWNRDCNRIYFIVRSGWDGKGGTRINVPCSIHADGTGLAVQDFIGGHPDWAEGSLLIGRKGKRQILYDVDKKKVVEQWGTPEIFPDPEGDISLSPDGQWFVNGHKDGDQNYYTVYRRSDGAFALSEGVYKGNNRGDIRVDPAPRWNRSNDAILVPGIAENGTRQLFVIRVIPTGNSASPVQEKVEIKAADRPNIVFILVDDMGWSDLGCYGGEIATPNIDSLAEQGVRFTQFYNTAKCMSSRGCLLTGLYAQQCGMGRQPGDLVHSVTLGEVLRTEGYRTLASGKHHGTENLFDRGFDHYYGLRDGCCNYWNPGEQRSGEPPPGNKGTIRYWCDDEKTYAPYTPENRSFYTTDAFTDKPLQWLEEKALDDKPFFLYLAYTAPHYPLHAWPADIAKYKGKYDGGYEAIRKARYDRMIETGLIDPEKNPLPEWDEADWSNLSGVELEKEKRRMEIYAAMLDRADQNIGRILAKLKAQGKLGNTLILFASDNGGCAEGAGAKNRSEELDDFGTVASYETVGKNWATVQNTPLRKWKNYSHEGGIRTPFIISWPGRIKNPGGYTDQPAHLIDIMPTLVELTGATYPDSFNGKPVIPMQGISLLPALQGTPLDRKNPLFWQWAKGGAVRDGEMKAVFWGEGKNRKWELYDLSNDCNETDDLASVLPERLEALQRRWQRWYDEVSLVVPQK